MKKKFLNGSIGIIKKNNPEISEEQIEIITYGLEGIYLTWTKMIVIFSLAIILGIVKEVLLLLVFYNIIRTNAFGIHATKSIYCLISSLTLFVGGVYVCKYLSIGIELKIILSLICVWCLFRYAPADTYKRPIVNMKKRKRFKVLSVITGLIFLGLIVWFHEDIISNYLLVGMIEAVLMIHPFVYKIFGLPFDNYKNYDGGV